MSVVYSGKWFTVEQEPMTLANGSTILAEWVSRTDGVRIVARREDGAVLLNNEYRHEICRRDFRLPGGKIENGCTQVEAAARELHEETGFRASTWKPLCATQPFTMVRYSLHYFEARDLTFDPVDHDEGEDIEVCWFSLDEVTEMALDGRIGEDLSALQILRLARRNPA